MCLFDSEVNAHTPWICKSSEERLRLTGFRFSGEDILAASTGNEQLGWICFPFLLVLPADVNLTHCVSVDSFWKLLLASLLGLRLMMCPGDALRRADLATLDCLFCPLNIPCSGAFGGTLRARRLCPAWLCVFFSSSFVDMDLPRREIGTLSSRSFLPLFDPSSNDPTSTTIGSKKLSLYNIAQSSDS